MAFLSHVLCLFRLIKQLLCALLISLLVYLERLICISIVVFVVKEVKVFHGEMQSCVAKAISLSGGDRSWILCASLLQMPVLINLLLGYCNKK